MIDERTRELIHAELDGELDATGRAELERLLAGSPQARALRDQLQRLSTELGRLVPDEPPAELREAVLAAVRPSAQVVPLRKPARSRPALNYGLAVAATVMLGLVGLALLRGPQPELDASDMAGTMARHESLPEGKTLASVSVDAPEVHGSVALREGRGLWILDFDLSSGEPVEVSASYDGDQIRLGGLAQADGGVESLRAAPGSIGFVNAGNRHFAVFLEPTPGAAGTVRLKFLASGRVLQEATLQVPVAGR